MASDLFDELRDFLFSNWDPELTVEQWWERLGLAGWAAPSLPENAYGRGLSRSDSVQVQQIIGQHGALPAPGGLGLLLAAPTIATHGTQVQIDRFVKDIVTGKRAWCQLFSEPGAGSDLAGLGSRAELDGDEWIVNGQKVWTSGGHYADMGMLIARTNFEAPKHQGITYFGIDMHQPGMDIRPLKEMTGHALFNEVFMSDARVNNDSMIGAQNNGWAVANSTLMFERAGLGSGGSGAVSLAMPGTIGGHLPKRAGDFVRAKAPKVAKASEQASPSGGNEVSVTNTSVAAARSSGIGQFVALAKTRGVLGDPSVRQQLASLHTLMEIGRFNGERVKAARGKGQEIPGMANIGKLSMSMIVRLQRDLGLQIAGSSGMLHAYNDTDRKALDAATGEPQMAMITGMALYAQAPPIYGGTDQIQRNILAERALGLPKDPGIDAKTPFSQMVKNG
jgi:alkylation response protein AidB-like acyl-CoA dehydrogenase